MPRPRFARLPAEARRRLLETAAEEFAAHGYDGASLNRIVDAAGISKGALYYYFDDKADLFVTVAEMTWQELLPEQPLDLASLTAVTFWPALAGAMAEAAEKGRRKPWLAGIGRLIYQAPPAVDADRIAAQFEAARAWIAALLERGRELGVVRSDLPGDLLVTVVAAAAEAADRWMVERWDELEGEDAEGVEERLFALLVRIAAPDEKEVGR